MKNTQTFKDNCVLECPLECDTVSFDFEISFFDSSLDYLSDLMEILFQNKYNYTINADKNFVLLSVYYPTTQYTEIRQVPKTSLIDLISNLGGAIGIFLGFSIFSLIEIAEIFLQMILILFRRNAIKPTIVQDFSH